MLKLILSLKIRLLLCVIILFGIFSCKKTEEHGLLYRDSKGFTDVTIQAGLYRSRDSYSHCWGDINSNGFEDFFIINHAQAPALFMNNGDGTFRDISNISKANKGGDLHGCAIADYDNDGDQDIYVTTGAQAGKGLGHNRLYQNNGQGKFIDVAAEAGVNDPRGRGRTASWVDYNNDGYLDLFVANEIRKGAPSVLFRSNGDGTFTNVSVESGENTGNMRLLFTEMFKVKYLKKSKHFMDGPTHGQILIMMVTWISLPVFLLEW
jgi:hypothetical protein